MFLKKRLFRFVLLSAVVFFSLGCVSLSYFVELDDDASGKGTIHHSATFPDVGEKGASSLDSYIEKLNAEGWENIEIGSVGSDQFQLTADYKIDPVSGRGFPPSMKNFTLKVEEAENGYKYFTLDGTYDYTQLSEVWSNIQNADSSFSIDMGTYFGIGHTKVTKAEIDDFIQRYGEPKVEFKVKLPGNTPVETKGTWTNKSDYLDGKTDVIEFIWTPDKRPTGTLHVTRRWEPKVEVSDADIERNLMELVNRYEDEIPVGWDVNLLEMPTGGWINNLIFAHFNGEAYTCGSYQNYVIDFLDQIRTSSDPKTRNLLNGLDYGPIQTNGGGHVAVVVYPSGTNWQETGTVLDPWPTQRPQAYNINTWFLSLSTYAYGGYHPEVSFGMENAYPHLSGRPPSYPAQSDLDHNRAQPVKQILVINSPVTVMLKMADGSLAGVNPDGKAINQMPASVSFYALPKGNGEHSWFFMLPDQTVDVYLYGQDEGPVHMALVSAGNITGYEAQQIHSRESFVFAIEKNATLSPLRLEGGETVDAVSIDRDDFPEFVGAESSADRSLQPAPESNSTVPDSETYYDYDSDSGILGVLCLGLCCCIVIPLAVIILLLIFRKRNRNT